MNNLRKDIRADFEYSLKCYNPSKNVEKALLSEYDVMKAHYYLSDYFLSQGESVRFGIHDFNLLSSAVSRQWVSYNSIEKWEDPIHKIATLVYGINKNHAFNDGNKRTALLAMLLALKKINRQADCKKTEFETLLVRIAANELNQYKPYKKYEKNQDGEVLFIAEFIRHNTRKIEKEVHSLTYAEFDTKLRKFNVWLGNQQGNSINVYKTQTKRGLFGIKMKSQDERILQIGFKGWKNQVFPKTVKSVLKAAGITPENGTDSKVFYYGAEPEYKLIEEYYSVLKRLKDK